MNSKESLICSYLIISIFIVMKCFIPFTEFSSIEKQGIKCVERKGLNKEDVGWVTEGINCKKNKVSLKLGTHLLKEELDWPYNPIPIYLGATNFSEMDVLRILCLWMNHSVYSHTIIHSYIFIENFTLFYLETLVQLSNFRLMISLWAAAGQHMTYLGINTILLNKKGKEGMHNYANSQSSRPSLLK